MEAPETLQNAIVYFSDPDRCFQYALNLRWRTGLYLALVAALKITRSLAPAASGSARAASSNSASRWDDLRGFARSAWTSGCAPIGCSATVRTASVLAKWPAPLASLRSRHGSCCTGFARLWKAQAANFPARLRWTKHLLVAKSRTCTRRRSPKDQGAV